MATIGRRIASDGTVSYRVRVRVAGEPLRTRTFKRKTDAVAWAASVEADIGRGIYSPTTAERRRTLADLIDKFLTEHLPTKANNKSAHKVEVYLAWWKKQAGFVTLDKLTPQTIAGYRSRLTSQKSRRGGTLSGATVNRHLAALSSVCKWAWKELGWLPSNPVLSVSKRAESAGVVRFLSDVERKALLDAAAADPDPNIHTAIVVALSTGLRASNIRALTWDDVDLENNALRVLESKNGEGKWLPLIDVAATELREHFERDPSETGYVFKSTTHDEPADVNGAAWMRVKKAAGLTGAANFRFHDLRHTAGTYLNEAGASAIQIAAALGHKTLAMAKRYSHQSPEFTRSVFDKLTTRMAKKPAGG